METSKKFIWELEVKGIVDGIVTFTDDTEVFYTEKQLSYMVTDEPKDLTAQRELVLDNVVPEVLAAIQSEVIGEEPTNIVAKILEVIEKHNIRRGDFAAIMDRTSYKFKLILDTTVKSYNEVFNKAIWKAFGTYKEWRASEYFFEDIRVTDMKNLID